MRITKILGILGIILFLAGCVPSLHPLYTEKDVTFEPALVGTWAEERKEDEGKWIFEKSGENAYGLILKERGSTTLGQDNGKEIISKFDVHLVRLGEFLFMDLYPQALDSKSDFYKVHFIPVHTFMRVWIEGDILRLSMLNPDGFNDMLVQKKINIAYERLGNEDNPGFVLTGSTKELQEFVLTHARDEKVFPEPMELHRLK